MKIVSWNCNGAFRKKYEDLDRHYKADIYLIQECENPEKYPISDYSQWLANGIWIGDNENRGVATIVRSDSISIEPLDWPGKKFQYFIPVQVNDTFQLVNVWCHGANDRKNRYIRQFWEYLQLNQDKFKNIVLAGDFNSNSIWDKEHAERNHSNVVRILGQQNIISAYHIKYDERQGKESIPTFYLYRNTEKPYHLDYIFVSSEFHKDCDTFEIGDWNMWSALSDHCPISIELESNY